MRHEPKIRGAIARQADAILLQLTPITPMTPRSEIVKGTAVREFTIERKAGEGAFGAVFAARDGNTGERVALKMLLDRVKLDPEQIERFKREAAFLSRVKSPHVAQMKEFFVDPTHGMILVMEFVEGELLSDLLSAGRLTIEEALELGTHLLVGVRDLHQAKIVHRDIKPANVMIRRLAHGGHRAVIFDLGLSRALANTGATGADPDKSMMSITGAHTALGTLQYMAPEQVINARQATERSDLYAIGAILFRAVSGTEPFEGDERTIARNKLMVEAETFDTGRNDPVAEGFRALVAKAMRRRPAQRYQTASEMLEALEELRRLSLGWGAGEKMSREERSYRAQLPTIMPDDMGSGASLPPPPPSNGQLYGAPSPSDRAVSARNFDLSQPGVAAFRPVSSASLSSAAPGGAKPKRGGWIAVAVAVAVAVGGAGWFFFAH